MTSRLAPQRSLTRYQTELRSDRSLSAIPISQPMDNRHANIPLCDTIKIRLKLMSRTPHVQDIAIHNVQHQPTGVWGGDMFNVAFPTRLRKAPHLRSTQVLLPKKIIGLGNWHDDASRGFHNAGRRQPPDSSSTNSHNRCRQFEPAL
jgi:hypothetical protein